MKSAFAPTVALLALAVQLAYAADVKLLLAVMNAQQAADATIQASAVQTTSTDGIQNAASGAAGSAGSPSDTTNPDPMSIDVPVRAGAISELFLAILVQQLVNAQVFQLDSSIPSRLLPGGIAFQHPAFTSTPMTLRQLLTHTSGIQDTVRFFQSPNQVSAGGGNSVTDLRSFCTAYFLTATGTGSQVATDIWVLEKQPGLAKSFTYAKSNMALLGYIVQTIIGERTSLVAGPKTVGGYMQEQIFRPLGLTNTYFLLPDGSAPLVFDTLSMLEGKRIVELNSAGGITTTQPIHASYVSDLMLYTSAADVTKVLYALFIDSTSSFFSVGSAMLSAAIAVTDSTRPSVAKVGFGVVVFNVKTLCAGWTAAASTSECPMSTTRAVYGVLATGATASVVGMCTDAPTTTVTSSTVKRACSSAVQAYRVQSGRSDTNVNALASGGFDQLFVDRTSTAGTTITADSQKRSDLFGFLVFLAILGVIFIVLLFALFVEYIVQPAPIAGVVTADAYRRPPKDYDD